MTIPELSLDEAWGLLRDDARSVLVDVRTQAEWSFVGIPSLDELGKQARFAEWTTFPSGDRNAEFLSQAAADLAQDTPIVLLCRSGARSLAAANALGDAGYALTYNVTAGFEGDLDADGHRNGGWKTHLPWRQG